MSPKAKRERPRLILGGIADRTFSRFIRYHFERLKWAVEPVDDDKLVNDAVAKPGQRLLVLDAALPGAVECCQQIKTNPESWRVPVFVIFSGKDQRERERMFFVCGDHHLFEPFEMVDFFRLVEREAQRLSREGETGVLEIKVQVPSARREMERVQQLLGKLMTNAGLAESRCWEVDTALREGLLNAHQHGNRGAADKMVRVLFRSDPRQIMITVQDEGPGFDYRRYVALGKAEDPISLVRRRALEGRVGGLGILLMTKSVDDVRYSPDGSAVTFVKFR